MLGGATLTTISPSWIDLGSSLGLRAEIPLTKRTNQSVSTKCVLQFHYSRCTSQTTMLPSVMLQFTECRCPISSPGFISRSRNRLS